MTQDKHEMVKNIADVASVVATIGAWLQMFTPIFGLIGAVWTVMRIAEMVSGKPFNQLIKRNRSEQRDQEKP